MKMRRIKQLGCLILSGLILLGEPGSVAVSASQRNPEDAVSVKVERATGLLEPEIHTAGAVDAKQIYEAPARSGIYGSAVYSSEWDKYSSNYYYNQLSAAEKKVWDTMDAMCLSYLTGKADMKAQTYQGETYYLTDYVVSGSMSSAQLATLARLFRTSNPQYYYLSTEMWSAYSPAGAAALAFGVYPAFADGDARATESAKVKSTADAWIASVAQYSSEEQKMKVLHDTVVNKVDYDNYFISLSGNALLEYETTAYTQSAYSVFCKDLTVCAGYSQALQMICNGAGIDAVAVTSNDHQWNKVRLNDSWYNVDATWADQSWGIDYYYFERSDAVYDMDYSSYAQSHAEEEIWNGYLPACTLDSGSTDTVAGVLPQISASTADPTISITSSGSKYKVTISCNTPGAKIYYTTDGTEPTPAYTRSMRYTGTFSVGKNVTVKAVAVSDGYWDSAVTSAVAQEAISYKVAFDGNGSTGGSMKKQSMTYGSGKALTANAFKKKGYTFIGWNTKADGSGKSYANKADGSKLTEKEGKTVKLYAQWKKTKYQINYKLNGGKNNKGNPSGYTITTATKKLKNPTRKGYTFKGWYTDSKYKNKITQIKKGSTGKKTLYAKWSANKYTITYHGNKSTAGKMTATSNCKYDNSYTLKKNTFERKGYTFAGWNTKADGSGTSYKNKASVKNLSSKNGGNVTLYAQWEKSKYKITYKLNGGTNHSKNPVAYTSKTSTIKLKNPTRKGYTFKGWYTDAQYKKKITQIKKGSTGKKTLYAKWSANKYTIVYEGNNSTNGKMSEVSGCKYGKNYTLKQNAFTRESYTFTGWNTKADGSGASYKDGESVKNLSAKNGGKVTLYAQWKKE